MKKNIEYHSILIQGFVKVDLSTFNGVVEEESDDIVLQKKLKQIAIDLDSAYPDHISKSKNLYSISMLNGQITPINKAKIKSYKYFAAFRTIEDAKIACSIVKPLLKRMFSGK